MGGGGGLEPRFIMRFVINLRDLEGVAANR